MAKLLGPQEKWVNRMKKGQLAFLQTAIHRWFKLPEAQGFGKVTSAGITSAWNEGPRVSVELDDVMDGEFVRLLFYFKPRMLGFKVVAVWTVKPRERIWPAGDADGLDEADSLLRLTDSRAKNSG